MSARPWTARTFVVAAVSVAVHGTAGEFAMSGIWWPGLVLAGVWAGIGAVAWWLWRDDRRPARGPGCCTTCGGRGTAYDPSTNGLCTDCFGTGHPHGGRCKR